VRAAAPGKPLMISETGSSEKGGSKAAWIREALEVQLPQSFPAVKGLVWWNRFEDGFDWPIETSASAQAAFAEHRFPVLRRQSPLRAPSSPISAP
jgi:hypothetical protein